MTHGASSDNQDPLHPLGYGSAVSRASKRGPLNRAYFDLIPESPDIQRGWRRGLRALLAELPAVAHPDSEVRSVAAERDARDGGVELVLPQPLLQLVVPDRDRAIAAGRGECIVSERSE